MLPWDMSMRRESSGKVRGMSVATYSLSFEVGLQMVLKTKEYVLSQGVPPQREQEATICPTTAKHQETPAA